MATEAQAAAIVGHDQELGFGRERAVARGAANLIVKQPDALIQRAPRSQDDSRSRAIQPPRAERHAYRVLGQAVITAMAGQGNILRHQPVMAAQASLRLGIETLGQAAIVIALQPWPRHMGSPQRRTVLRRPGALAGIVTLRTEASLHR